MADSDFDDALEADALTAAQEACDQARGEYREKRMVNARACIWKTVDPLTGQHLAQPARMYLEFPRTDGRPAPSGRAALKELSKTLRGLEAVAALLVTVVPDTEKPEHNVVIQLETPRHRRRVWMANIRSDDHILGDFEEVNLDGSLFLLPQASQDETFTTGIYRRNAG